MNKIEVRRILYLLANISVTFFITGVGVGFLLGGI